MNEQLGELENIALQARAKKGRMDAESREKASAVIVAIWTDPAADPQATLQFLGDLKPEAIADAIGKTWPQIDEGRRELFDRWLPAPLAEKDIRRLALLITSVAETDPAYGVRWLNRLAPPERKSITKEARQHLAASLLADAKDFSTIAVGAQNPRDALRLYSLLWNIATDIEFSVTAMARARLAKAILAFTSTQEPSQTGSAASVLLSQVRDDFEHWPTILRQEVEATLPQAPASPVTPVHAPPPDAIPPQIVSVSSTFRTPSTGEPVPLGELQTRLGEALTTLPKIDELLRALHGALGGYAVEIQHRADKLSEAQRELTNVRAQIVTIIGDRDTAKAEVNEQRERLQALTSELGQLNEQADTERRRLSQQIAANATGRIDEYKNKLALALSRLVIDLPDKQTIVSDELGRVILLQFHQFLDALRQEGIDVRAGAASR